MSLPDLIEIVPVSAPLQASLTIPGSKSITNRALICGALAQGKVTLRDALWSEDTQAMVDSLSRLGFVIDVQANLREASNRTIEITGHGGRIPNAGTPEKPLELFVGNAGTAARFLAALVCLGHGSYRLTGVARMHQRPQAALIDALRELGNKVEANGACLPLTIHAQGPRSGRCSVSITESSQFASALILVSGTAGWQIDIRGENAEESPYVEMTRQLCAKFPHQGGDFVVEPDASSGSYFWGANWLLSHGNTKGTLIQVEQWPASGWQIDAEFPKFLPLPLSVSRASDLGDSIMTAIVLALFSQQRVQFTELGRLRLQETERVLALKTELNKCAGKEIATERGDTLFIQPSALSGGVEIETYDDHRMAMCFAMLGLKVPGLRIKNPSCVKKTFPDFFLKLATPPPHGLGVQVKDARTAKILRGNELMAE